MRLRRACADDARRLAALARWVWLDSYALSGVEERFLTCLDESFTREVFERLIADPAQLLWIVEDGATLQGFAQSRRGVQAPVATAAAIELERLYVAPPCTGRGLGALLLQAARETLAPEPLWLSVWEGNAGALRFYAREGGQTVGESDFILDGQPIRNLVIAFP
ncbi:GNAT family N-acetyltransferase [Roseateles asaccharophilus]|uniref:Ribosomal protein S18 acetylase RimI-like enzyme n=1 Tax=Roseateles asaccharophilus TaxID=582607 RepID=A0ABU2ACB4_9BURK|nr:GNAT family N-acetyltransferase [Roseateles asaccharophilus]MDR7334765.1 ribosomal protein S18 acetylase RimI-like enzyme [Roseateles asaccharophilus]